MTADGLAGELPTGVILALCDRLLGEVGRRSHRFAWLRAPGSVADAWLPVEAYYPGRRLVVVCHEREPYDHLFRELIPEHGLRLLQFTPGELGGDPGMAELKLSRMIEELPPPPGRPGEREPRERAGAASGRTRRRVVRPRPSEPAGSDAREARTRAAAAPDGADAAVLGAGAPAPAAGAARRDPRGGRAAARAQTAERPQRPAERPARTAERAPRTTERTPRTAERGPRTAERAPGPGFPSVSVPSFAGIAERRGAAARAPAARPTRVSAPRTRSSEPANAETVAVGVAAGLVLAAICGAELVLGVLAVTFSSGRVLLGLGIAFDACARALGALDAGRAGKAGWAWACAIIGSPAVVAAALSWRRGAIRIEAAPLAGLMAGLAMVFVVIGLLA